jgi:hypothetical protein
MLDDLFLAYRRRCGWHELGKREVSNLRFFFSKKYIYDVARWTLGGLGEAEKFTSIC